MTEYFDTVVIGSGFGGSTFAYRMAQAGKTVCVLERGRAYPPGSYPRAPSEMRKNFWDPSEGMHGLFDVWSFRGISALVASGLGGGSLIYANVLLRKPEQWFVTPLRTGGYRPWPITRDVLEPHYDAVERMMDVQRYPFEHAPYARTAKTLEFQRAARKLRLQVETPPLAVSFAAPGEQPKPGQVFDTDRRNLHGALRMTCRLCGECDVGCNDGSKNSLDFTYLSAARALGAEIRTSCEAKTITPLARGGYEVRYLERRYDVADGVLTSSVEKVVHTKRLALAAGTLGTAFLLLSNRAQLPGLSARLGRGFSGNGDALSFVTRARTADGGARRLSPSYGPVITSTLHSDLSDPRGAYFVQDAGFPNFASWLVDTVDVNSTRKRFTRAARTLVRSWLSGSRPTRIGARVAALLPDDAGSAAAMPLLAMGMDVPEGKLSLRHQRGRARLDLEWPRRGSREYFRLVERTSRALARVMDADFTANPLQSTLKQLVTVHPLGGCAMGRSPSEGVVDEFCQVYGHPDLYVVDGSVMPGPIGPNPSLTIAAVADRAASRLC